MKILLGRSRAVRIGIALAAMTPGITLMLMTVPGRNFFVMMAGLGILVAMAFGVLWGIGALSREFSE
ncbi:hypothetical protein LCGC14_1464710 [marine sediment metagenome]|uniref:Uncharacterized protein n=1 Tax=marine sediment metagenome TaxID=412755 RepID=A0A0F9K018_9ZZZZ